MTELDTAALRYARTLELALDAATLERLIGYRQLLLRWTRSINLIAGGDASQFDTRHLLDSLILAPHLDAEATLLDLGSGGGLPGLVLAALDPSRTVILCEPIARKAAFLRRAVAELALDQVEVIADRVERIEFAAVDVVTARAVARLDVLCELARERVAVGGRFLFLKGREYAGELDALPAWVGIRACHEHLLPPDDRVSVVVELERLA